MRKAIFAVALLLSACATTPHGSDYVVKVNGVETNTEKVEEPNYLLPALIIGAGIGLGLLVTSGGSDNSGTDDKAAQYQACLNAGFPVDYCRRTVYGT